MTDSASIDSAPVAVASLERPHGLTGRLGDWLNPVLVKEVRQAQRGKVFTVALVVTVLVTLLVCAIMALNLSSRTSQPGRDFFTAIYLFVCGAMLLVVPFQAFSSMGSEWDDHTYEMLVLSNLKPSQIVLGKLLSATVQSAMLLAVFLPFLATAFLLRGVDMLVLGVVLALTAYASVWLSTFAIMLSAVTRNRLLRVLLMVILGGGLVSVISGAVAISQEFINRPDQLAGDEFWIILAQVLVVFSLMALLAFVISCNLLAHEEENRSSNTRLLATFSMVVFLGLLAVNVALPSVPMPRDGVFGLSTMAVFLLAVFSIYFCSEPERLGRRVAPTVPKSPAVAFFTLPWYPGGGRGAAFLLLHLGGLIAGAFAIAVFADPSPYYYGPGSSPPAESHLMNEGGRALLLSALYAILYSLVPIGILGLFLRNTRGRRRFIRTISIFSPFLYVFIPSLVGLVIGSYQLQQMTHVGNPVLTISRSMGGRVWRSEGVYFILLPLAVLGVVLALPKIFRAVRESATVHRARPLASVAARPERVTPSDS